MVTKAKKDDLAFSSFRSDDVAALIPADGEDRPSYLVLHRKYQVIAIELGSSTEEEIAISKRLNRKIAGLKENIQELSTLEIIRIVVCTQHSGSLKKIGNASAVVSSSHFHSGEWTKFLDELESGDPNESVLEELNARLHPAMSFVFAIRDGAKDEGKDARETVRVTLDAAQISLVTRDVKDALLITGPPGSGKTLLLIARAKWLSTNHPKWIIKIVTYNNLLATYLKTLVLDFPHVEVCTFRDFVASRGHKISENDETRALGDFSKAKRLGILQDIDALLIDEAQDFFPAWIRFCLESTRTKNGGVVLVGDEKQSIYRDGSFSGAFQGHQLEIAQLHRPYRCTKQIMHVAEILSACNSATSSALSLDGPPVDLIYADSWQKTAEAIVWEISRMVLSGERDPGAIAILCTQYKPMFGLIGQLLETEGIPYTQIGRPPYSGEIQAGAVTISTIHSAKGYEYEVVFLFGVDNLPYKRSSTEEEIEEERHLAYVAATRSKDQLFIMYTKSGELIKNLSNCDPNSLTRWVYPDDYPLNEA